jgi:putative tryptophan/tyrosine transport system substrate-binding protein
VTEIKYQRSAVRGQRTETTAEMRCAERFLCAASMMISISGLRLLIAALCSLLLAPCSSAQAQQPVKSARIGFLVASSASSFAARDEAFRKRLHELGWIEGKNMTSEYRYADGNRDRLSALAAELVRLDVDVIVTVGPADTRAAKQATAKIPIVMAADTDPVETGFVATLARPGGNITGLSTLSPEMSGKQLELLKEIGPKISRVSVFGNSSEPGNAAELKGIGIAAKISGLQLQILDVRRADDLETAFSTSRKDRADALVVLRNPVTAVYRKQVVDFAFKSRLPSMFGTTPWVDSGGLMSYGPDLTDLARRAATYADKILKGVKPADLPVEQPTKFELVINLKTAKQIGLTIPPNVLARADRVIR